MGIYRKRNTWDLGVREGPDKRIANENMGSGEGGEEEVGVVQVAGVDKLVGNMRIGMEVLEDKLGLYLADVSSSG